MLAALIAALGATAAPLWVAAPASAATPPSIVALGPVTAATAKPGQQATAQFTVFAGDAPLAAGAYIFFSAGTPFAGTTVAPSSSIAGCAAGKVAAASPSNALTCLLPAIPAGGSLTFTYRAALPVDTGSTVSFTADLQVDTIPNSQLGWIDYGTAAVPFTYGIAPSASPGVTSFVAPITYSPSSLSAPVSAPPAVVAVNRPWAAEVIVTGYNTTVAPLTVTVTAPPGATLTPRSSSTAAASFACTATTATVTTCTGGTVGAASQAMWILSGVAPATAGTQTISVTADPGGTAPVGVLGAPATATATFKTSATLPDLQVTAVASSPAFAGTPFTVTFTVTNQGTAPAGGLGLVATTPVYAASTSSSVFTCTDTVKGHSGRGGGYTHTGLACTAPSTKKLAVGASVTLTETLTETHALTLTQSLTATTTTVQLDDVAHTVSSSIAVTLPPVPGAPTILGVGQSGDELLVLWAAAPAGGAQVTSTVSAVPTAGATLTASAPLGANGAWVVGVEPSTTYTINVTSADLSGTGPASTPVTFTTGPATVAPTAPTALTASWSGSSIVASWTASTPGDSPISDYQVQATAYDTGGPAPAPVVVDSGPATTIGIGGLDSTLDWSIQVRALNSFGWGPWSTAVIVPALN